MTSTPASRSARATTFAPRSWPSSPTFATITRILLMTVSVTGTSRLAAHGDARPGGTGSVDAGNAVLRGDGTALRARGGDGNGRARGRRGGAGAGHRGVRAEHDLDVPRRHRGTRGRGDAEERSDLAGARRRTGAVQHLGRGQRGGVPDMPGLVAVLDQGG